MTSSNRDAEVTLESHVQTGMAPVEDEERPVDPWVLEYWSYVPGEELLREALCTVGNGRFATRGAAPEHPRMEGVHYPGTYAAGVYNRLISEKARREIENESLVNLPRIPGSRNRGYWSLEERLFCHWLRAGKRSSSRRTGGK